LLALARSFVEKLNKVAIAHGGWGLAFCCDPSHDLPKLGKGKERLESLRRLLEKALEEELKDFVGQVLRDARYESATILVRAQEILRGVQDYIARESSDESLRDDRTLDLLKELTAAVQQGIRSGWMEELKSRLDASVVAVAKIGESRRGQLVDTLGTALESIKRCQALANSNIQDQTIAKVAVVMSSVHKILNSILVKYRDSLPGEVHLRLATASNLIGQFRKGIFERSRGEVASLLDLVAIYTLRICEQLNRGIRSDIESKQVNASKATAESILQPVSINREEPRVALTSDPVRRVLAELEKAGNFPHQGLLHLYLPRKLNASEGCPVNRMDEVFMRSFEEILHPAWRFFARHWHDHSEALLMARACLDLGSSRFREEVVGGFRHLLEQVEWSRIRVAGASIEVAHGHDECTLCTSRLLYIFSYARRLFLDEDLGKLSENAKERGLNETVKGLLTYMLSRDPQESSWWGFGPSQKEDDPSAVWSADYLAWAARAVSFCLSIDREVHAKTGEYWLSGGRGTLGLERRRLELLLRERWQQLFAATTEELLNKRAEEPQSFILSRVALAYLDLGWLDPAIREIAVSNEATVARFLRRFAKVYSKIWHRNLSQLSSFYLWPAMILRDQLMEDDKKAASADTLVDLCLSCVESKIWIGKGPDTGSWGFNVKNTQAIVTAMAIFWRYAFDARNKPRFEAAFANFRRGSEIQRGARPPAQRKQKDVTKQGKLAGTREGLSGGFEK